MRLLISIGSLCRNWRQCPDGQYCIWGKCLCFNGQILMNDRCIQDFYCQNGQEVYHNGQCYYLSAIGDKCYIDEQCYGESFCINNYCTCPHEMINMNGLCQKKDSKPIRQCEKNQVLVNKQCLNIVVVGEECQVDAQCTGGANCLNRHCSCPPGTIQNEQICIQKNCSKDAVLINGTCLSRVIPGELCVDSAQCLDGSQCSTMTNVCICLEGMNNIGGYCRKLSYTDPCDSISMVYANNSCMWIAELGDQCIYDLQCLGGSICTDGYCNCPETTVNISGYCTGPMLCNRDEVYLNNRCFKRVSLNESCLISQQCPGTAICNYMARCACPTGMIIINERCQSYEINYCNDVEVMINGQCVERRIPGATCFTNEQCLDESSCINEYCKCSHGTELLSGYCIRRNGTEKCDTYQIYVNGQCLNLAIPGEGCVDNLQCIASSTCRGGKCVCLSGYIEVQKYCIRDFRPSRRCNSNQILINAHCYEFAKIGENCVDTAVCLGGSICYNNYCTCPKNTIVQNGHCRKEQYCREDQIRIDGQCYQQINIGRYCQFTEQCASISTCQNGICICPPNTVPQNNICVPSGLCPTGQIYIVESCWDIAYIGQECRFSQQCQGYSICIDNLCRCPKDTVLQDGLCTKEQCNSNETMIDGMCFKMAKIEESCYHTKQCEGNAICQRNRCMCPPGTINSNGTCIINLNCEPYQISINDSCFDTVSIGMTCQHNPQCIESATCISKTSLNNPDRKTCQCNSGTVFTGSKCLASSIQCPASTVYMINNICHPLVKIGQFCMYTIQCMGHSICSNQICKCPIDFTVIRNICRRKN
ncbi:Prion-like-(Q/N-rich) domain-bearing protein [Dirofilaria immitis]